MVVSFRKAWIAEIPNSGRKFWISLYCRSIQFYGCFTIFLLLYYTCFFCLTCYLSQRKVCGRYIPYSLGPIWFSSTQLKFDIRTVSEKERKQMLQKISYQCPKIKFMFSYPYSPIYILVQCFFSYFGGSSIYNNL